jgi:hypothetical protein
MQARLSVEFGEGARKLRGSLFERQKTEPDLGMAVLTALAGPEILPAELFTQDAARRALGAPLEGIE